MRIHFSPLFRFEITHDYYLGGLCSDLDFVMASNEPAFIEGKLLARVRDNRLHVLYEAGDDGAALRKISGSTLWIGLHQNNPAFSNFTLNPAPMGSVLFYHNRTSPTSFDPPLAVNMIQPGQHLLTPDNGTRPLRLSWQYLGGASPAAVAEATLAAGENSAAFATRLWPHGDYQLESQASGPPQVSRWLHLPPLAAEPLWGVIAITIDDNFYNQAPALQLSLQARSEVLRYYVVASNFGNTEFEQLQLTDAGAAEQNRPALSFERIAAADFGSDDIPADSLRDASSKVVLFRSQQPVARRAGGYRKLQLQRNHEVLVQHLPQAGSDRAQARFIVHLAKS